MQIIKYNKQKQNIYEIYIKDKKDPIILFDETILYFNLISKKTISEEELIEIINYNNELEAYYKALKYINVKMRTKQEISKYLTKNNFSQKAINQSISRLSNEGYLDEIKYIKAYIIDQINLSLNGPDKIKNNLLALGLNVENIAEELEKIDKDIWQEKIKKIIMKRLKANKDSQQGFILKTARYLQNNGYAKVLYNDILENTKVEDQDNFLKQANILYKKLAKKYNKDQLYFNLKNKLYIKGFSSDQINEFIISIKKES